MLVDYILVKINIVYSMVFVIKQRYPIFLTFPIEGEGPVFISTTFLRTKKLILSLVWYLPFWLNLFWVWLKILDERNLCVCLIIFISVRIWLTNLFLEKFVKIQLNFWRFFPEFHIRKQITTVHWSDLKPYKTGRNLRYMKQR